jgi:hypothetical protein
LGDWIRLYVRIAKSIGALVECLVVGRFRMAVPREDWPK